MDQLIGSEGEWRRKRHQPSEGERSSREQDRARDEQEGEREGEGEGEAVSFKPATTAPACTTAASALVRSSTMRSPFGRPELEAGELGNVELHSASSVGQQQLLLASESLEVVSERLAGGDDENCPNEQLAGCRCAARHANLSEPGYLYKEQEQEKLKQLRTTTRTKLELLKVGRTKREGASSAFLATIVILLAYELSFELATRTKLNLSCQRCLPDEDSVLHRASFVSICSAFAVDANNSSARKTMTIVPSLHEESSILDKPNATEATANMTTAPTKPATVTPTPKRSSASSINANVLCNSRCNCVLLEPLAPTAAAKSFTGDTKQEDLAKEAGLASEKPAVAAAANNASQQRNQTEQALIAFTEDYSLDYDDQSAPTLDEPGALDIAPAVTLRPGANDDSQASPASLASSSSSSSSSPPPPGSTRQQQQLPLVNQTPGRRDEEHQSAGANPNSTLLTTTTTMTPNSTTAEPLQNSTSSNSSELQSPANPAQSSTASDGQPGARQPQLHVAGQTPSVGAPNGANSGSLLHLFPLPSHHHRGGAGGGLNLAAPLGSAGSRDSSGPQLYAQSLYSSQAPKLSYHAHTPYLKSAVAASGLGLGGVGVGEPGATPGGGPSSYPYHHHMRAGYLAHHLRQLPSSSAATQSLRLASTGSGGHDVVGLNLIPLRKLDFSGKLRMTSSNSSQSVGAQANSSNSTWTNEANETTSQQPAIGWEEFPQLIDSIQVLLAKIEQDGVQSLSLRSNELQFELWSELYALLALQMRQRLFHLDLSHNRLAKLGITFTGYIEHHLAAHGSWPSAAPANQSSSAASSSSQQQQVSLGATSQSTSMQAAGGGGGQLANKLKVSNRVRHSLLSGGKLYALVRQRLNASNNFSATTVGGGGSHNQASSNPLVQPMLVRALDLSHNKLKWLINDQFRALRYVQTIRLDHNRIRYIHQHAFSGLETLRFLNLNFNQLQVIYIEQFQTNYNLLALMLRSNYLAYLRGGSFASLANLKRLDLSQNKLTIVSNNAFVGLESLELLNCSSNQFVHAPSASLHPLTSLRQLDLSDNLIAQLAPGTFFHLPIEELWLSENEQLIAIDRGAFWDLPYLRRLHLSANPMLMSINSQAFVGTQALQAIDVDECPSLDTSAKQMLENITMAATSRLLRHEQQHQSGPTPATINSGLGFDANSSLATAANSLTKDSSSAKNSTMTTNHLEFPNNSTTNAQATPTSRSINSTTTRTRTVNSSSTANNDEILATIANITSQQSSVRGQITGNENASNRWRYVYYLGVLSLLMVSLKLVFKYTSTSHYMETRRRRRRVYEAKSRSSDACSELGATTGSRGGSLSDAQSTMSNSGDSYEMCEQPEQQSHHNVIMSNNRSSGSSGRRSSGVDNDQLASPYDVGCQSASGNAEHLACEIPGDAIGAENSHRQQSLDASGDSSDAGSSVIVEGPQALLMGACCPDCPTNGQQQQQKEQSEAAGEQQGGPATPTCCQEAAANGAEGGVQCNHNQQQQQHDQQAIEQQQQQQSANPTIDLIRSQLIAAGFDYGHANCAHFYQSLGPALQLADITANFVNQMGDYY